MDRYFTHSSAIIEEGATIGSGTKIWHLCHVRNNATIGDICVLGRGVFVDTGVYIGNFVKIQNYVSVFQGVTLEDGVFVGPHACFTNDVRPRAVTRDLKPKDPDDWTIVETRVRIGASIGANATVICGVEIGKWAMVGGGAVVTSTVPDYGLVVGNPARLVGYVCRCGKRQSNVNAAMHCDCGKEGGGANDPAENTANHRYC